MRVFVSYASERALVAREFVESLRGAGHSVFFAEDALAAGETYHQRIRSHLFACDVFVFVASRESLQPDNYALTELELARERWPNPDGHVVPVLLPDVAYEELPAYLKQITALRPEGSLTAAVVNAVERIADARTKSRIRRSALGLGIAATIAIGSWFAFREVEGGETPSAAGPEEASAASTLKFRPAQWLAQQGVPDWPFAEDSVAIVKVGFFSGLLLDDMRDDSAAALLFARLQAQAPVVLELMRHLGIRQFGPLLVSAASEKSFLFALLIDRSSYDDGSLAIAAAGIKPLASREVAGCRIHVLKTGPRVEMGLAIAPSNGSAASTEAARGTRDARYTEVLLLGEESLVEAALRRRLGSDSQTPTLFDGLEHVAAYTGNWAAWSNTVESGTTDELLGVKLLRPRMVLIGTTDMRLDSFDEISGGSSSPLDDFSAKMLLDYRTVADGSAAVAGLEALKLEMSRRLDYSGGQSAATMIADSMGLPAVAFMLALLESVQVLQDESRAIVLLDTARLGGVAFESRLIALTEAEIERARSVRSRRLSQATEDLTARIREHLHDKSQISQDQLALELQGVSDPARVLIPLIVEYRNDWQRATDLVMLISSCRDHPQQLDDWLENGIVDLLSIPATFADSTGTTETIVQVVFSNIVLGLAPPGNLAELASKYSRSEFPMVFEICLAQALCVPNPKALRVWENLLETLGTANAQLAPFRAVAGRALGKCAALDPEIGFNAVVENWDVIPPDVVPHLLLQMEADLNGLSFDAQKRVRLAILRLPPTDCRAQLLGVIGD